MTKNIERPDALPLRSATAIPVEWLKLDQQNPRLIALGDEKPGSERIIEQIHLAEE